MLSIFWRSHNPTGRVRSSQYKPVVFFHSQSQKNSIHTSLENTIGVNEEKLTTEIRPLDMFYRAEDYHQKHYLRRNDTLMREFQDYSEVQFADSPTATSLNGFLADQGDKKNLESQVDNFSFSDQGKKYLKRRFHL